MRLLLAALVVLAGCGGDDDGGGPDAGGGNPACQTREGRTPASGAVRIGQVTAPYGSRSEVEGVLVGGTDWQFFDMAPQRQIESARSGDCVLYEWQPSFCEPECLDGLCHQGECTSYPEPVSAGTLAVEVAGEAIQLEADQPTFWGAIYRAAIPPPAEGAAIAVCAAGDAAGGFGALLEAVPPLGGALPQGGILELEDGGDVVVSWDSGSDARVRLTLNADNQSHGLPYRAILECDADDTGSLVIPQSLVEAFPAVPRPPDGPVVCAGTDCPPSQLVRYRAVRVDEPDLAVEVRAESAVEFAIAH